MADTRFFKRKGPFTLEELATIGQCEIGRGDPSLRLEDVAPLDKADGTCISLFHNPKYKTALEVTKAAACVLSPQWVEATPTHLPLLIAKFPYRSYALIARAFYAEDEREGKIAATAVVAPTAKLGKGVRIDPFAVIGENVELGDYVYIGPYATIGDGVSIGDHSIVGSHVSLSHALLGKHVHIKPGARIGQSGFGFFRDKGDMGGHVPVPQLGRVIIQDYVEIGANTTVDRGSGPDTIIGMGTRIDNLVQVAHNVQFGKGCVIVAQCGISGSTKFGDFVAAGGQVGITEHLNIGTGVQIAAQSGIMRDLAPGEVVMGSPAMPIKDHYRQVATLKKLAETKGKPANRG